MTQQTQAVFIPLSIAVLTVSDTRTEETDRSGGYLADALTATGHRLAEKRIELDDLYRLRTHFSQWIADPSINVILSTGGTGFSPRDITPDAVTPLLDHEIPGFGELYRQLSFNEVGTSTIQSRAVGGIANGTYIFCLPGSTNACRTAWEKILMQQLDHRHRPCNFVELMVKSGRLKG